MANEPIETVIEQHTGELMAIPGVVGVAQGRRNRRPCVLVFVRARTQQILREVPAMLEGYRVVVEASGAFRSFLR